MNYVVGLIYLVLLLFAFVVGVSGDQGLLRRVAN